ncbi:tetratricopeptide repeat protein, partial [Escherichia coli]|uniref:tetratricopeptide repeat protein n=1 Tax=Escherichia coli TaxID=562 RepID=UPI001AA1B0CC
MARAMVNRGVVQARGEHTDEAIADYSRVIDMQDAPVDSVARALHFRGNIINALGRPDDAIADFTRVIELDGASDDRIA